MRIQFDWADLPFWRKAILVACLGAFFWLGPMDAYEHARICFSAPAVPMPVAGQTYAVYVMHGSLRYVTRKEYEDAQYWRAKAGFVGVPFLVALLTLSAFRGRS